MGGYARAGQLTSGDRCQPKALGRENHACGWEGVGRVSADLQSRQEHRLSSHVVFKLLELLVFPAHGASASSKEQATRS